MIVEYLLTALIDFFGNLLLHFPAPDTEFIFDFSQDISDYVRVVLYVIPVSRLLPLIGLIVSIGALRIFMAFFKLVKGCIPFMST